MSEKLYIIDDILLMNEWDYEANQALDPNKLTRGSNKIASWICSKCNHKWKTTIYHRATAGTGCRKCHYSKRQNISFNESIAYTNPETRKNWHPTKNHKLTPDLFKPGSRYKAWWQCHECGNEWEIPIKNYNGCSYCRRHSELLKNNLKKHNPELACEWHPTKNGAITPRGVSPSSNKIAWWKCSKCGYEWDAKISNRTNGRGCPLCANRVVVEGINDLSTTHPQLANEWHLTKNRNLSPKDVTYGSGKRVWWTCALGHEYTATILHRSSGTNCPVCNSGRQTSFAEQAVFYYVKKLYPDAINRYTATFLGRMELDIYIPSIKYAIEYDGAAWHKKGTIKREELKYKKCKEKGIKLIRMMEKSPELGSFNADYTFGTDKLYEHKKLEYLIKEILRRINFSGTWLIKCPIDVNIKRDRFKIQDYKLNLKKDSLSDKFPQFAEEWHPTKNGKLTPSMFTPGSNHKIWWECPSCNYEYEATISHRTNGTDCPKCAIEKVTQVKRKPVNMIDPNTGEIVSKFISISDASRKMKINVSNISMVCKGKRPKAGGYYWSYDKS